MQDLVIKTTLPELSGNFETVKQQLIDGLKTYDVIITAETVKDGKTMASEINKIKKAIKDQEKIALEKVLGPVGNFKDKIKELLDLADEAREKIKAEVEAEIENFGIRPEFQTVEFEDLVKLTAVTKTGNLTSATLNLIKARVTEAKAIQYENDVRLENEKREREAELERIRAEERAKDEAEAKAKAEAEAQAKIDAEVKARLDAEAKASTPPEAFQEPMEYRQPEPDPELQAAQNFQVNTPESYMEQPAPFETINMDTGEVMQTAPIKDHYPNGDLTPPELVPSSSIPTKVKIIAEFPVDVSKVPNITEAQLIKALQSKLQKAGINNAVIQDLMWF